MIGAPSGRRMPFTASVAVATPTEPTSFAEPSAVVPAENWTIPAGVTPSLLVAVAVRNTTSVVPSEVRLLSRVKLTLGGAGTLQPFQQVNNFHTSTDPR